MGEVGFIVAQTIRTVQIFRRSDGSDDSDDQTIRHSDGSDGSDSSDDSDIQTVRRSDLRTSESPKARNHLLPGLSLPSLSSPAVNPSFRSPPMWCHQLSLWAPHLTAFISPTVTFPKPNPSDPSDSLSVRKSEHPTVRSSDENMAIFHLIYSHLSSQT